MTPLMQIVWEVLASAKDAGIEETIGHCRRLIVANRLGKTRNPEFAADKAHVLNVYDEVCSA